jgi:Putative zinc-finger
MFNHERFLKLAALEIIGQLSAQEYRELDAHLKECAECRGVQEDYSRIIYHEVPKLNPAGQRCGLPSRPVPDDSRRDRFLARALSEGIEFSPHILSPHAERPRVLRQWLLHSIWHRRLELAFSALVVMSVTGLLLNRESRLDPRLSALKPASAHQTVETPQSQAQLLNPRQSQKETDVAGVRGNKSISDESVRRPPRDMDNARTRTAQLSSELSPSQDADFAGIEQERDTGLTRSCCTRRTKREFTWSENRSWQ